MQLRMLAPRYWPTWAGLGMLRLLSLLPFGWLVALGRTLGAILRRLAVRFG
ncbi:MAG: lipid A biosynthesis acyltransferase, partial [Gammaproteobacteria bacterium]